MTGVNEIKFSEWWDKLVGRAINDEFHTARWIDKLKYYEARVGQVFTLNVHRKPIYKAELLEVIKATIGELSDGFIHADTYPDWSRKRFYDTLHNWYHRRPEWKGWNSEICIMFLKVTGHLAEGEHVDTCPDCKVSTGVPRGGAIFSLIFNGARTFECSKCGRMWIITEDDGKTMKEIANTVIYGSKEGRK